MKHKAKKSADVDDASSPPPGRWRADQLLRLAKADDLPREEIRIAMYLIAKINPKEGRKSIPQAEIAKALSMKQSNVSRGIAGLEASKILKVIAIGRSNTYRLTDCNPATDEVNKD